MSMVYLVMKHNIIIVLYVYKFSLIILERESSARIDACHDDVKDLPAPQIPLTVSTVDDTVIISSEF